MMMARSQTKNRIRRHITYSIEQQRKKETEQQQTERKKNEKQIGKQKTENV